VAGVFVIVLEVSGSIFAFGPEVDYPLNPGLFRVAVGPQRLPMKTMLKMPRQGDPRQKITGLVLPSSPGVKTYIAQFKAIRISLDGYKGEVIGARLLPTTLRASFNCTCSC
jgi:uncharacterized iron-regulated membrane protein